MGLPISAKIESHLPIPVNKKPQIVNPKMEIEIIDLETDLFSFLPNGATKNDAISVEQYEEEKQIQNAIFASAHNIIDLDCYEDDVVMLDVKPEFTPPRRNRRNSPNSPLIEIGESSNSKSKISEISDLSPPPEFICEICIEPRSQNQSFRIKGCSHSYCTECMSKFVGAKLQENITAIQCPVPNCGGLLEPEYCRSILPPEVFNRWGDALCEASILGAQSFYCPFKDCSALLIDDGIEKVMQSSCPNCWRMFCAQCKVPWHSGIDCGEFQKLHKDEREREDIILLKLAKDKKWARCPKCRIVVERTQGCRYIKCRCGTAFCYDCGGTSVDNYHYCHTCKR